MREKPKTIPVDWEVDGVRVLGTMKLMARPIQEEAAAPELDVATGPTAPEDIADQSTEIGADVMSLPELESGPSDGDWGLCIHKGNAYRHRIGRAPAIIKGGQSSLNVWDLGAREGRNNSNEFQVVVNALRDGGKLRIPCGHFDVCPDELTDEVANRPGVAVAMVRGGHDDTAWHGV